MEGRVVGCLVEKQLTTPQQYPLTLNSLTLACNQTSNRDPVVDWSEDEVHAALDRLKAQGMVRFVLPSHGRSVVRYRHVLDERFALDPRQMALVAVLLLRGPQTAGELRVRTERMADFDGVTAVESDLEGLARWEEPLVARLGRRPGQKEERWAQLLSPTAEPAAEAAAQPADGAGRAGGSREPGVRAGIEAVEGLRAELDRLRQEVGRLRADLDELRRDLGVSP